MPNYEYQCGICEYRFTEFLKIDERKNPEKTPCPECGKKKVKQGFVLM